jgi:phytoene dehydrogenase-like protein
MILLILISIAVCFLSSDSLPVKKFRFTHSLWQSQSNQLEVDICCVGGGVAGLVTSTKLKYDKPNKTVMIVEKGSAVGGRMSSHFIETSSGSFRFDSLLPDVYKETFELLGEKLADHVELMKVEPLYRCFFEEDNTFVDISNDKIVMKRTVESIEPTSWNRFCKYMKTAQSFLEFGLPNVIQERFSSNYLIEFIQSCLQAFPLRSHAEGECIHTSMHASSQR